jgi:hypothetical protein
VGAFASLRGVHRVCGHERPSHMDMLNHGAPDSSNQCVTSCPGRCTVGSCGRVFRQRLRPGHVVAGVGLARDELDDRLVMTDVRSVVLKPRRVAVFEHARIGARHTGRVDTRLALADDRCNRACPRRLAQPPLPRVAARVPVRTGGRGATPSRLRRGKQQGPVAMAPPRRTCPASMVTDSPHVSPPRVAARQPNPRQHKRAPCGLHGAAL